MRYIPFSSDLAQCSIFHNLLAYSKLLSPKNSIVTKKNKAKNRASLKQDKAQNHRGLIFE